MLYSLLPRPLEFSGPRLQSWAHSIPPSSVVLISPCTTPFHCVGDILKNIPEPCLTNSTAVIKLQVKYDQRSFSSV